MYGQLNLQNLSLAEFDFTKYGDEGDGLKNGLKEFNNNLKQLKNQFNDQASLNAILDEMIADVDQLIYLLMFK